MHYSDILTLYQHSTFFPLPSISNSTCLFCSAECFPLGLGTKAVGLYKTAYTMQIAFLLSNCVCSVIQKTHTVRHSEA